MEVRSWVYTAVLAFMSVGCASNPESADPSGTAESAVAAKGGPVTNADHLRVLVAYENGQFRVERVTKINAPLRQPRSGRVRPGLAYVASQAGKPVFLGNAPDPRFVHVETPNSVTGELEHSEARAPGKQHFLVYVPTSTEVVDFQEQLKNSNAVSALTAGKTTSPALGRVDLRPFR
jgi:hypothetical protein